MSRRRTLAAAAALLLLAACGSGGDADAAFERGRAAFAAGQPRTAKVELLNALSANPGHREARRLQAEVHLALGDGVAAEAELARLARGGAADPTLAPLFAHSRLLQGDPEGALARLESAGPLEGVAAIEAERMRGRALDARGDAAGAAAAFDRAVALGPEDAAAWTDLARFRRARGDIAGAIGAADRAVTLGPDHVEALVLRGELTRGQYGLQAALAWFDRALEIDPQNVPALLERATTYGDIGRMRDMLADTRRALSLAPGHRWAYYLQAMLAARARNFELARSLYQRTGGAFEDQPAGLLLAGAIALETGNPAQAAQLLERLSERQPGNRKVRRLLASAQWRAEDPAAAIETLRPIVDRPDADSYSLTLAARALERLGDQRTAAWYRSRAARPQQAERTALAGGPVGEGELAELRRAAAARPGHAPAEIALITALLGRGQGPEALARAERLQAANPGAPDAHMLVGDARGISGDFRGAAEAYRRAANLAFTEPVALRLIEALRRSNQPAAADQVLTLFANQNPRNVPAKLMLAARAMERADWAEAVRLYEALRARLGNNDATILNNLAWAYQEQGALDRAVPLARRAWELDRDNPATADTLGWILFKSGRRAEGLVLLERAARGAPGDAEIRARLEQARLS
jgi:cellulose synthase operon protein C